MDFSGGISAFVLPMMSRQSPDVTAFTLPLNHPDAPVLVAMTAAYTQDLGGIAPTRREAEVDLGERIRRRVPPDASAPAWLHGHGWVSAPLAGGARGWGGSA